MEYPVVSVVVPIYNVEQYLERCLDSLLNQSYQNFEIVLVDDGSTDSSPGICDRYTNQKNKVITYHISNGGLGAARNYGVKMAKADLIAFVDSDDFVESRYLEDMVSLYEKYRADLVITRIVRELENGKRIQRSKKYDDYLLNQKEAFFAVYSGKYVGWEAYGKLYKKELLLSNPFPSGYYEDFACIYKIIGDCKRVVIGNCENNYHYITREKSILTGKFNKKHLHVFDVCDELRKYILDNYPEYEVLSYLLYERAIIQLFNLQKLNLETKKKIYKKYKKIFRKGMIPILLSKEISKESKAYAITLGLGIQGVEISKKLKGIIRE